MVSVLNRVFVTQFYTRNAGTFLVVILLAFGFLSGREHKALILAALGSPFFLGVVFLLWTLYFLKTSAFIRQELSEPEHLFLQTFWLVPASTRWFFWLIVQTALLFPIIAYAAWMVQLAVLYQQWGSGSALVLFIIGLLIAGIWWADHRLRHPSPDRFRLPTVNSKLPYELFFPAYWLRHEPVSLVLTKAFSGLLLAGVCRLYPTDDYDQRLLLIGLLFAVIGHSQVGGQVSAFERRFLLILPNLPLSWPQRFGRYMLTYGLIWLPELLILLRNCPSAISYGYVTWLWLTGWGWILLLHSLAYGYDGLPERWLSGIFMSFFVGLVAIMFRVPVGVWFLLGWGGALGIQIYRFARSAAKAGNSRFPS